MGGAPPSTQRLCLAACRATTHTDLLLRAQDEGIETHIVHNASIMNAAGACGLQLYNFGATVSIPFFRDDWRPDSWYPKIKYNAGGGMHTLCLLGGLTVLLASGSLGAQEELVWWSDTCVRFS